MGLPAKKYDENFNFIIIQPQKYNKGNYKHFKFLAVLILVFVIVGLIISSSLKINSSNRLETESEIVWSNPPCSPRELGKNWKEITHKIKKLKTDDLEFLNIITNEIIEFHPRDTQGRKRPHWHRKNPSSTNKSDYYLDKDGNPVRKKSKKSHIYPNC